MSTGQPSTTTTTTNNNNNNNKVARASAAARGVSFIFGRFFAPSPGMFVICEVFVNNRKFWCFGKPMFLGLFF